MMTKAGVSGCVEIMVGGPHVEPALVYLKQNLKGM
jgi:hypothetical protein